MAPPPTPRRLARTLLEPWKAASTSLFTALFSITSRTSKRYTCAAFENDPEHEKKLTEAFGTAPGTRANDGVVPIRSQLWGTLAWTGHADHLDVLGHYDARNDGHVDWLRSGSDFGPRGFEEMLDRIFAGMRG